MSKKLKKAISLLATFMSGLGGTSQASQNEIADTKISSSESGDLNTKIAALSVAGDVALKDSSANNKEEKNDDLVNSDILNDETLQEEGIDPAVFDRLELKCANLPSPSHIGAIGVKDFGNKTINRKDDQGDQKGELAVESRISNSIENKKEKENDDKSTTSENPSVPVNLKSPAIEGPAPTPLPEYDSMREPRNLDNNNRNANEYSDLDLNNLPPAASILETTSSTTEDKNVKKSSISISFSPEVEEPAPTPSLPEITKSQSLDNYPKIPQPISSSWEKIYEEPKPDFTGITSCGVDNALISSFYDLQQDSLVLKNKKQVLEYSSDSSLYQEVSFKLENNVNNIVDIIKKQKTKLLSGDKKAVTSRVKKIVKFYHTLNNAINKCIQSLKDKDLSEKTRSEIDAAVREYVENPRMKLWWYKDKDNLCPFNNVVAKLGEAKLILLYTNLLLTSIGSSDTTSYGIFMDDEENIVDKVDKETEELKSIITADDPFFNYKSINSSNKDDELFRDMAAEVEGDYF